MKQLIRTSNPQGATRVRSIKHVLYAVVVFNVCVAVAKLAYGYFTSSTAMQADGLDSLFDGIGSVVGIVGMVLASRPPDHDHPYGHAKFETYASLAIGILLAIGAVRIAWEAIESLVTGSSNLQVTAASYIVMGVSIVANALVSHYERTMGKRYSSEILLADAKHSLTDVLVSGSVILGLIISQAGYPMADPIITLVVSGCIFFTAWNVFRQGNQTLSDKVRIPEQDIRAIVDTCEGVQSCHRIRTRGTLSEVYLDLHILVDPSMTVMEAHKLGDRVTDAVEARYPQIIDTTVHIEPDIPEERLES